MEWLRPTFAGPLPLWPFLSRRPLEMPQTAAPACLLAKWVLLFYLLLEEKQPVTVGLLWMQQTAFVSPNSKMLQKATEWAGDCFLGREPQVWAQWWEEATVSTHQDLSLCVLPYTHTLSLSLTHVHTRARAHIHTYTHSGYSLCSSTRAHISESNRSVTFVMCILPQAYASFYEWVSRNYWWPGSIQSALKPHHR